MFYVYVLESETVSILYIGFTVDLMKRLEEHNKGLSNFTRKYKPWKLIYYEACVNEKDAKRREKYLKTTQGGRLLKRRLKEYLYDK